MHIRYKYMLCWYGHTSQRTALVLKCVDVINNSGPLYPFVTFVSILSRPRSHSGIDIMCFISLLSTNGSR